MTEQEFNNLYIGQSVTLTGFTNSAVVTGMYYRDYAWRVSLDVPGLGPVTDLTFDDIGAFVSMADILDSERMVN